MFILELIQELQKENIALKKSVEQYRNLLYGKKKHGKDFEFMEIEKVCRKHGIGTFEIFKGRQPCKMNARKELAFIFRKKGYTYERIGKIFGTTHGAILYLVNEYNKGKIRLNVKNAKKK